MERMAWPMRPSSFSFHCTYEPRPTGTLCAATTIVPPRVSPSSRARSTSATMVVSCWRLTARRGVRIAGGADGDDAGADVNVERAQQLLGDRPRGNARRGLARGGALEDVAQVAARVLHPADEVRVPRPRRMHAPLLRLGRVDV